MADAITMNEQWEIFNLVVAFVFGFLFGLDIADKGKSK